MYSGNHYILRCCEKYGSKNVWHCDGIEGHVSGRNSSTKGHCYIANRDGYFPKFITDRNGTVYSVMALIYKNMRN